MEEFMFKRLSTGFVMDVVCLGESLRGREDGQWRGGFVQRILSRTLRADGNGWGKKDEIRRMNGTREIC